MLSSCQNAEKTNNPVTAESINENNGDAITYDENNAATLTYDEKVEDLNYLSDNIKKKHKNVFHSITEEQFNDEIESLKEKLSDMNDSEFNIAISEIVASIGDSHTTARLNGDEYYPILFYYFKDGIYIIGISDDYKEYLGTKLVAIQDCDITEVEENVSKFFASETDIWRKVQIPNILDCKTILDYYGYTSELGNCKYTVEFQDGHRESFELSGYKDSVNSPIDSSYVEVDDSASSLITNQKDTNYYLTLTDDNLIYLQYNKCYEDPDYKISDLNKELNEYLKQESIKLIIDLRNNSGGDNRVLYPIIRTVIDSKVNEKNKLFIFAGRKTFSSAVLNLLTFINSTNCIVIGEPTGNAANHYGYPRSFSLPNSNILIRYSTQYYSWNPEIKDSVLPDYDVSSTFSDYISGKDLCLEKVMELIGQ